MRFLFFLCLVGAFFCGGFFGARWLKTGALLSEKKKSAPLVDSPFQPTLFPIQNHSFVIVIVGRNNGAYLEKTVQSALSQNYSPFQIVYVDDHSDDGSFELIRDLIATQSEYAKVQLVRNELYLGFLGSLIRAIAPLESRDIVVVLHGEDRLAHEWVLQRLNQYYAHPDLWMTYGQYLVLNSYQMGLCKPIGNEPLRSAPFYASHLKTFYAGLFKQVKESDLLPYHAAAEMALMMPLIELAQGHVGYIPEILYLATKRQEKQEAALKAEKQIRSLPAYPPLKGVF